MASRVTEGAPNAGDDLDDLFGYELNDEVLKAIDTEKEQRRPQQQKHSYGGGNDNEDDNNNNEGSGAGLGLEEVKIAKKRQPVAKLDEERLLSQAGVPKLRTLVNNKLVLKGKGHEFEDVSRILEMYQLWMDDLYPRAKMSDALTIVEKLGHSKRMQVVRRQWVDEGKQVNNPHDIVVESRDAENNAADGEQQNQPNEAEPFADSGVGHTGINTFDSDNDDDDDGEGLFVPERSKQTDDVPMDDLDALLAEDESVDLPATGKNSDREADDIMQDDLDAIMAEDIEQRNAGSSKHPDEANNGTGPQPDDFADDMEAMRDAWA